MRKLALGKLSNLLNVTQLEKSRTHVHLNLKLLTTILFQVEFAYKEVV
jgi:hypothetical protein